MKKTLLAVYIALLFVFIGLIFQFLEAGVFGENPIPNITQYHQILFWGGIAIWAIGYARKRTGQKKASQGHQTNLDSKK